MSRLGVIVLMVNRIGAARAQKVSMRPPADVGVHVATMAMSDPGSHFALSITGSTGPGGVFRMMHQAKNLVPACGTGTHLAASKDLFE